MKSEGMFISLEGIDGCGKSSLKQELLNYLKSFEIICIREPGGTQVSEMIRGILLDVSNQGITARTEALLYASARSQVVEEVIRPALHQGKIVLADRFMDSTIAYQGYGRGLDIAFLKTLNQICTAGLKPHLTLLLDIDPSEGQNRKKKDILDRLEKEGIGFQAAVREGYKQIAREEPERIKIIDASQDIKTVAEEAMIHIRAKMNETMLVGQ